jgi:hypothetical protein
LQADLTGTDGDVAANAAGLSSLDTRVTSSEGELTSQGTAITQLQADLTSADGDIAANAAAFSGLSTTVTQQGDYISALSSDLTLLQASVGGNSAAITSLQSTKVDGTGAIAAVETEIAAEFGGLAAMATATEYARATAEGINAGFIWELNGQNVLELISVAGGVGSAQVTARIDADYIQITGLTQIDQAVIGTLAADAAFLGSLTVQTLNIGENAVTIPVSAQQGVPATLTEVDVWLPILKVAINREGFATRISFSAQLSGGGGSQGLYGQEAAIVNTRLKRGDTVIEGPIYHTSGQYGHPSQMVWNVTDPDDGTGPTIYTVEATKVSRGTHYLDPYLRAADLSVQQFKR